MEPHFVITLSFTESDFFTAPTGIQKIFYVMNRCFVTVLSFTDSAADSGLEPMIKLAETISDHWVGVTRYFKSRLTNGISEGINSLIQTVKRRARGYKNMRHFINMIYLVKGGLELPSFSFAG